VDGREAVCHLKAEPDSGMAANNHEALRTLETEERYRTILRTDDNKTCFVNDVQKPIRSMHVGEA